MQKRIDDRRERYSFESLRELSDYIAATPPTWTLASSKSIQGQRALHSWDLGARYEGALELARSGWIEGAQRTQEALKAFRPNAKTMTIKNDFYGYRPNVQRYIAGQPDCMVRSAQAERPAPALSLIVPICADSGTDAKHMANFGVALVQLIRQMEQAGTRCEVLGAFTDILSHKRMTVTWRVKHADQPLDLAVLAFAIGHPAMFRRLGFALIERSEQPNQPGYGRTDNTKLADCINPPRNAIIVNGAQDANRIASTPERALEYLRDAIATAARGGDILVKGLEDA